MKFRAKIVDVICIHHFTRIITTISKMVNVCVLRLTPDRVYFILLDKHVASVWCELIEERVFGEYSLEGVSEEHNEIFLETTTDNLVKALKSAHAAQSVKVKLTRKHGASLTFEVELLSNVARNQLLIQDIPVTVIPRRFWNEFNEPDMPAFDVTIVMPPLRIMRNLVDRLKHISNQIVITASQQGIMCLSMDTDEVSIRTRFDDLVNVHADNGSNSSRSHRRRDRLQEAEVKVDVKKLSQFLTVQLINPDKVICNVVHQRTVHFLLIHDDITLQYFMPAITD